LALTRRRRTVLALRRLLTVALLGWSTVLAAGGSAVAAWGGVVGLLVLGVVAVVDGTKEELDDPEIGGEVDGRVGAGHLFLLILEV
jgi:drug/metabolite transporter superfamily protein YnfA